MIRIFRRTVPMLCLLALVATAATASTPAPPAGTWLTDSTTVDQWTLPNGLRVVARHVPGAHAVSVTWGYRLGMDDEPADRLGWASLLAEVVFTAPAGGTPERTREEMESLRPLGWSLRVNRRQTLFTETATRAQLPGVLHQIAERMGGVRVTEANLQRSLATVRDALDEQSRGVGDADLYWQVREQALGIGPDELARRAEAKTLARVGPDAVRRALAYACVPANGVLAFAGDLAGLDLRAVVGAQFGGLPGGERPPDPRPVRLAAGTAVVERPGLTQPVAVVGLFAPELADTMHADFYMTMLLLGSQAKALWGQPEPPLGTRFQYALLDDPDFVRFYPKLRPGDEGDAQSPSTRVHAALFDALAVPVEPGTFATFRDNVLWLLGGPMPARLLETMRHDPAALNLLCVTSASRALWGDEEFWSAYRRRFGAEGFANPGRWSDWLSSPQLRASLLVVPAR